MQGLKGRFLLAKAICCDPADAPDDDDEMVGVVAPLVRALLDEGGAACRAGWRCWALRREGGRRP